MSSSEGFPYVQHNNKNDLEDSGSDSNVDSNEDENVSSSDSNKNDLEDSGSESNVDSNEDENESSSDSDTKIEKASILDTVRLLSLFLYIYFLLLVPNLNQYSLKKKKKNLIYLNI